jgi:hypothetical protein
MPAVGMPTASRGMFHLSSSVKEVRRHPTSLHHRGTAWASKRYWQSINRTLPLCRIILHLTSCSGGPAQSPGLLPSFYIAITFLHLTNRACYLATSRTSQPYFKTPALLHTSGKLLPYKPPNWHTKLWTRMDQRPCTQRDEHPGLNTYFTNRTRNGAGHSEV